MEEGDEFLSQDEIDSLLGGDDNDKQPEETAGGKVIRPFDPATQKRVVSARLHTFDIINERFARHFRTSLFNLIRRSADVTAGPLKIQKYSDFTRYLPIPSNINLISMKPLRGQAVIVFPPEFVFLVIDSLFGGNGRFLTKPEGRDFTRTEQRIIHRMVLLALDSYNVGWERVFPVEMAYERSEMQIKFANITNTDNEVVVSTEFHVEVGSFETSFFICMPYAMIEPIQEQLSGPFFKKDPEEEKQRIDQISNEVKQSRVKLSADFTKIKTTLEKVQNLAVNDVFPIEMPSQITARVDGVPVLQCGYGSRNGHKALRVTRVINHLNEKSFQGTES